MVMVKGEKCQGCDWFWGVDEGVYEEVIKKSAFDGVRGQRHWALNVVIKLLE